MRTLERDLAKIVGIKMLSTKIKIYNWPQKKLGESQTENLTYLFVVSTNSETFCCYTFPSVVYLERSERVQLDN